MAALAFTPYVRMPQAFTPKPKHKSKRKSRVLSLQSSLTTSFSDPFVLELADSLEDSLPSSPSLQSLPLSRIRDTSSQSLIATPWPSRKDEPFRFTDTSFIRHSQIYPAPRPQFSQFLDTSTETQDPSVAIADGYVMDLSNLSQLPNGVYVGSLLELSNESIVKRVSENLCSFQWGDLFWSINGAGAPDMMVVYVPPGCQVENPIHLKYFSVEGCKQGSNKLPLSNPRVLVLVEKGGGIDLVEEFVHGDGNKCYWSNSALEVVIGEGGRVRHSYVQGQSLHAAHIKWTSVRQESASSYELVEVSTGGKLSRHNLHVQQQGPETVTELSTFHLAVGSQTQDLHSRLVLNHPRGCSQQLHKCIVAHSEGQAVFDGNVQVNRYAQQTDAGQLTRSLLLEPRATVNVKPNLQIIANDVKCSHGAAISDLEDSQLFYFLARGVDLATARKALTVSFAKEVIERLSYPSLQEKATSHIKELLDPARKGSS